MKKSLESNIVSAKTDQGSNNIILFSQAIVLFNMISMTVEDHNNTAGDRSKFLIYQACVAPQSDYSVFFLEVMPINQFILYINDIIKTTPKSKVYTYADDTTLILTAPNVQDLQKLAQTELTNLINYFYINNLVPNPTKTNYTKCFIY